MTFPQNLTYKDITIFIWYEQLWLTHSYKYHICIACCGIIFKKNVFLFYFVVFYVI